MIRDCMDGGRDSTILTINIYMCLPNYKNMLGFWCREYLGKLRFWSLNGGVMLVVCVSISENANHFAYANTEHSENGIIPHPYSQLHHHHTATAIQPHSHTVCHEMPPTSPRASITCLDLMTTHGRRAMPSGPSYHSSNSPITDH